MPVGRVSRRDFAARTLALATGSLFGSAPVACAPSANVRRVPPWEPDARPDPAWQDYAHELAAAARAARPLTLFIGDSISARWLDDGLEVWKRDPHLRGAFTLGIGGDTTQNVLWRIREGALDGLDPAVAIVMIGVNDVDDFDAASIARGVLAVVAATRERLADARLIVFGVLPRGVAPEEPGRRSIAAIDAALAEHRFGANAQYVDATRAFVDAHGRQIATYFHDDRVHLTAAGYARWAEVLDPLLAPSHTKRPRQVPSGASGQSTRS
jgi:beta-glucosidase